MSQKKNILIFGDSNTWGLIPGTNQRYSEDVRYGGILRKAFIDRYNVIEEGLVGRTTIYNDIRYGRKGIDIIPILLESHMPDIFVIMLGTNDLKINNARKEEDVYNAVDKLLSKILELSNTKILLISPILLDENIESLDSDFDNVSYELSLRLKDIYKELSIKYNTLYLDASKYAFPSIDGEHMNDESHKKLADAIKGIIDGI